MAEWADALDLKPMADNGVRVQISPGACNLDRKEVRTMLEIKGKETYFQERDEIIRTYKEQGRRKEIQAALEKISWNQRKTTMPEDLCFLYGEYLADYLHDVEIC